MILRKAKIQQLAKKEKDYILRFKTIRPLLSKSYS